jgi:hypothetical protein
LKLKGSPSTQQEQRLRHFQYSKKEGTVVHSPSTTVTKKQEAAASHRVLLEGGERASAAAEISAEKKSTKANPAVQVQEAGTRLSKI